eukprot:CAMPEP_0181116676 /NCGR_PEP_ID=MMETSP1071-20121207/22086_1 /TAXON_ID=35127 /ORGANISM="Thalassiosira sp., Strain NH16" /LENGTH=159 /DNA_ID=CAMNT_0023200953 /DNA_START=233 /DNA_END=708 /DNA_ORIENTATION=+
MYYREEEDYRMDNSARSNRSRSNDDVAYDDDGHDDDDGSYGRAQSYPNYGQHNNNSDGSYDKSLTRRISNDSKKVKSEPRDPNQEFYHASFSASVATENTDKMGNLHSLPVSRENARPDRTSSTIITEAKTEKTEKTSSISSSSTGSRRRRKEVERERA